MKYDNLVLGHKGFLGSSFTRFLKKNNIPFTFIDEENLNYKKDFKKFFNFLSLVLTSYFFCKSETFFCEILNSDIKNALDQYRSRAVYFNYYFISPASL